MESKTNDVRPGGEPQCGQAAGSSSMSLRSAERRAGACPQGRSGEGAVVLLEKQHPGAVAGEQVGGDQAADAGADDDRVVVRVRGAPQAAEEAFHRDAPAWCIPMESWLSTDAAVRNEFTGLKWV